MLFYILILEFYYYCKKVIDLLISQFSEIQCTLFVCLPNIFKKKKSFPSITEGTEKLIILILNNFNKIKV